MKFGDFLITVKRTLGKVAIVRSGFNGVNITAYLMRLSLKKWLHFPDYFVTLHLFEFF